MNATSNAAIEREKSPLQSDVRLSAPERTTCEADENCKRAGTAK